MPLPETEDRANVEPPRTKRDKAGEKDQRRFGCLLNAGVLLAFFLLYVLACSAWQGDTPTTWKAAVGLLLLVLLVVYAFAPKLKHKVTSAANYVGGWIPFSLLVAGAWLYCVRSYNRTLDYLMLLICFAAALLRLRHEVWGWLRARDLRKPHPLRGTPGLTFAFIFLIGSWGVASELDLLFTLVPAQPRDPGRFRTLRDDWRYRDLKVGVALSGGGYRAALMHAGVLDAFERLRVPVTHLTSVSGGSIIGAFYAAGGKPEDFRAVVAEGRFNLTRELTKPLNALRLLAPGRIPLTKTRLLWFGDFSRADVQANLLDRVLLDRVTFDHLEHEGAPRLMVCATDLYSGASVGMSKQGVLRRFMIKPGEKDAYVNVDDKQENCTFVESHDGFPAKARLSQVVAASGAFPGAFNAVKRELSLDGGPSPVLLADGGLSDNSALTVMAFANARAQGWGLDIAVSSDASALFDKREDIEALGEVTRAIDIVYANIGVRRDLGQSAPANRTQLLLTPGKYTDLAGEKSDRLGPAVEESVARLDATAVEFAFDLLSETGARDELPEFRDAALAGDAEARRRLAGLLHAELDAALSAFTTAATLEDNFGGETTGRLYRLGQLLVVLEWGKISEQLERKLGEKAGVAPVEVARPGGAGDGARARPER